MLGHTIIEGLGTTESVLKGSTSSPWVNPQSPLQYKANEAKMIVNATPTKTDFINIDIWPLGQPRVSHNPYLDRPPGLGTWYMNANIELLKKLHGISPCQTARCRFVGDSMAEPHLP